MKNFVPFFLIKCLNLADLTLELNAHETSYFRQRNAFQMLQRYNFRFMNTLLLSEFSTNSCKRLCKC